MLFLLIAAKKWTNNIFAREGEVCIKEKKRQNSLTDVNAQLCVEKLNGQVKELTDSYFPFPLHFHVLCLLIIDITHDGKRKSHSSWI